MSNYTNNELINDPNHVWSKILGLITTGSEVLDIGCSSGNLGKVLIDKKQCQVDGIEPDAEDATRAARQLRKVWQLNIEDPKTLNKINKKYDVLIFADVLEHLVEPAKTLREVKKLVRPGGVVIFSIPNVAHVSVRLALLGGNFDYTDTGLLDKTHLHLFDLENFNETVTRAGMTIQKLDASAYRYSDYLIQSRLNELGFQAKDKGLKLLHQPTATTFQYVGCLTYAVSMKAAKLEPKVQAIQKDVESLSTSLERKDREMGELNVSLHNLEKERNQLEAHMQAIINSKAYKVAQKAAKTYHIVRRSTRRSSAS